MINSNLTPHQSVLSANIKLEYMRDLISKRGITKYWWIPMLTGVLSVIIGIWCLCNPISSLSVLANTFVVMICGAGFANIIFSISNSKVMPEWGWPLTLGIIELIVGIWLFCMPQATLVSSFIYAVGLYLIYATINAICESCSLYSYNFNWFGWLMALLLITLVFAVIFMAGPIGGGIAVWLWIGISFISFGLYRIFFSLKIHKFNKRLSL